MRDIDKNINIISIALAQSNITNVKELCQLDFLNKKRYIIYWNVTQQQFVRYIPYICERIISSNITIPLDLSIVYRVDASSNYSGYIPPL